MQSEIRGNLKILAEQLHLFYRPLIYLDSHVFAYYELLLEDGDHNKVIASFGDDRKALFFYLDIV